MEFTLTERTEPLTLKEVLDFIDDTNISKKDAHELKSRIVDVVLDSEDRVIDEFANKLCEHCMQQTNECYKLECPFCTDGCDIINIAEQMKKGVCV